MVWCLSPLSVDNTIQLLTTVYVRFLFGEQGVVAEIVYAERSGVGGREATGVWTRDSRLHPTKLIVVAAGVVAGRLVPELDTQVVTKSWSVGTADMK
ncbi:hypothetical protein J7T55_001639 [Diaporthe amygdali]|uniref:uncharacterized protein n=1 Tax=Phomopsis amygdali TaxID=1214568 RepID=UPI0022FF25E4|nr:uncharacterized protein J7T55_001639 [Diaporthe amygdali]KAJ0115229.1 hypothetical protein J7T55_001639 [Diaporthe amygdali]